MTEDEKLIEYDVILQDCFLDILYDLHRSYIKEMVREFREHFGEYERKCDPHKLEEMGSVLTILEPRVSIVVVNSFY